MTVAVIRTPNRFTQGELARRVCDLCEVPGQLGYYEGPRYGCSGHLCWQCVRELIDEEHAIRAAKQQHERERRWNEALKAFEVNRARLQARQEACDREQQPERDACAAVIRLEGPGGAGLPVLDGGFDLDSLSPRAASAFIRERPGAVIDSLT